MLAHRPAPHLSIPGEDVALFVPPGNARMVKSHHFPLVVEHRRSGGTRRSVGVIVQPVVEHVDQPVCPQSELFWLAVGLLDDVQVFTDHHLALLFQQARPAKRSEFTPVLPSRLHGDQGIVQRRICPVKLGRSQRVKDRLGGAPVIAKLVIKLDLTVRRRSGAVQHVIVGHHQAG